MYILMPGRSRPKPVTIQKIVRPAPVSLLEKMPAPLILHKPAIVHLNPCYQPVLREKDPHKPLHRQQRNHDAARNQKEGRDRGAHLTAVRSLRALGKKFLPGKQSHRLELLFNPKQLVVLCDSIGTAQGSCFDLPCIHSHRQICNRRILRLSRPV